MLQCSLCNLLESPLLRSWKHLESLAIVRRLMALTHPDPFILPLQPLQHVPDQPEGVSSKLRVYYSQFLMKLSSRDQESMMMTKLVSLLTLKLLLRSAVFPGTGFELRLLLS